MKSAQTLAIGVAAGSFLIGIAVDRLILQPSPSEPRPPSSADSPDRDRENPDRSSRSRSGGNVSTFRGAIADLRDLALTGSGRPNDHEIRRALENTSVADATRLLDELTATPDDEATPILRRELYRRLAELDPSSALDRLLTHEKSFRLKAEIIQEVFRHMAGTDFEAAKKSFEKIENQDLRHRAIEGMSHAMANGDRSAVAAFVNTLPDAPEFRHFFHEWAIHAPDIASAFVLENASAANRASWLSGIGSGMAEENPTAALEWANGIEDFSDRSRAMQGILDSIAHTDPATAASLVGDFAAGHQRRSIIERVSSQWGREDPEAAVIWANELSGRDRTAALEHIIGPWTQRDPAAAASFVSTMPTSDRSLEAVHHVANRWAQSNSSDALEWAQNQQDPRVRERAIAGVASRIAEGDPQSAADFAASFENPSDRQSALDTVARHWANRDIASAVDWVDGLTGQDRARATHALMGEIADQNPTRAASYFNQLTSRESNAQTDHLPNIAGHIASRWSEYQPEDAAEWATTLPEGNIQRRAVEEISERWIRNDARGASEWIDQLPVGDTRDRATERLVQELVRDDPESAFEWASSINQPDRQTGLMRNVLHHWNQRDPNAARAGLAGAVNLSQEQRSALGQVIGSVGATEE